MAIRFLKQLAVARCFDLLHNSNLTVPMYAYRFELFVFGASMTSVKLIKFYENRTGGFSSRTLLLCFLVCFNPFFIPVSRVF